MIVRQVDANNDFTFGASLNNYLKNQAAVKQNIKTRLMEFFGDCFFNLTAGVNWFNLLGGKDPVALNIAVSTVILNTAQVLNMTQLSINVNDNTRAVSIAYSVNTTYGQQNELIVLNPTGF